MAYYTGRDLTDVQSARTAENLSVREASLRRALAAMAAMSEAGRQSSAERIAGGTAANEATRLQNLMTLGREQYGSQERVAGLNNANAATIAGLERASRLELGQLPFSDSQRAHELGLAKWKAMIVDPRYAGDTAQINADIRKLNSDAKIAAAAANNELFTGTEDAKKRWYWSDRESLPDAEIAKLAGNIYKGFVGTGKEQMFYNPTLKKFEALEMPETPLGIPRGFDATPTGPPAVPPLRPNRAMMEDSVPIVPTPVPYGPTSGSFSPPLGTVAVPTAAVTNAPPVAVPNRDPLGLAAMFHRAFGRVPPSTAQNVAVPTAPTNAITADLAKLATLGPVPPGTTSTNRATGMTYQFNGSTWQPLPR